MEENITFIKAELFLAATRCVTKMALWRFFKIRARLHLTWCQLNFATLWRGCLGLMGRTRMHAKHIFRRVWPTTRVILKRGSSFLKISGQPGGKANFGGPALGFCEIYMGINWPAVTGSVTVIPTLKSAVLLSCRVGNVCTATLKNNYFCQFMSMI